MINNKLLMEDNAYKALYITFYDDSKEHELYGVRCNSIEELVYPLSLLYTCKRIKGLYISYSDYYYSQYSTIKVKLDKILSIVKGLNTKTETTESNINNI